MAARARLLPVALALVAAAVCASGSARADTNSALCGVAPYSYAGVIGENPTGGVMATVELTATPQVQHGHVAAWVGVGGVGEGPGRSNEWLQVGLATTDSSPTELYFEVTRPNTAPRFVPLDVPAGQHRVGVAEMAHRPNWWRVWVDAKPVSAPTYLPGSHGRWAPVATSESWNGGVPSCNAFGYRFLDVRWSRPADRVRGLWSPLRNRYEIDDPGYSVQPTPDAGLLVSGGAPAA